MSDFLHTFLVLFLLTLGVGLTVDSRKLDGWPDVALRTLGFAALCGFCIVAGLVR